MTEKQKPAKPPKHKVDMEYGKMAPIRYPDRPDKRLGNWLLGLLTPWKR